MGLGMGRAVAAHDARCPPVQAERFEQRIGQPCVLVGDGRPSARRAVRGSPGPGSSRERAGCGPRRRCGSVRGSGAAPGRSARDPRPGRARPRAFARVPRDTRGRSRASSTAPAPISQATESRAAARSGRVSQRVPSRSNSTASSRCAGSAASARITSAHGFARGRGGIGTGAAHPSASQAVCPRTRGASVSGCDMFLSVCGSVRGRGEIGCVEDSRGADALGSPPARPVRPFPGPAAVPALASRPGSAHGFIHSPGPRTPRDS